MEHVPYEGMIFYGVSYLDAIFIIFWRVIC